MSSSDCTNQRDFVPILNHLRCTDLDAFKAHLLKTAKAGVRPLLAGSMGEAIHLSHSERVTIIQTARAVLDEAGLSHVPIIAGTGAGSTRETIELTKAAAAAGADYVIVIASGYFAGVLGSSRKALKAFWAEVSEKSPVPVILYNCTSHICWSNVSLTTCTDPGASGGIDLDSDLITEIAIDCPNTAGIKLTCVPHQGYLVLCLVDFADTGVETSES